MYRFLAPKFPISDNKDVSLPPGIGGHLSHRRLTSCFQGRRARWGGYSDLPSSAIFFIFRYSLCQAAMFWYSMSWTPSLDRKFSNTLFLPCIPGPGPLSFLVHTSMCQVGVKKRVWSHGKRAVNSSFAIYYLCDVGQVT